MKPVEIEYLLKDGASPGLEKIESGATSVEKVFTRSSENIKTRLREQRAEVKRVEGDLKALEGQLGKMAPGTAWMEMKAEIEACRKALAEEKVALSAIEQEHDKAAGSGQRLSRELRGLVDGMTRLRLEGKQLTPEYAEMERRAAELSDTLGDVRAQTNVLAHDNAGLQGVISGVSGLTGGITAAVGVMGVFTKNNEDLVKVQTKVQSVLAITMGLQQMMNVLNKDSAFRLVTLKKAKEAFAAANTRLAVALGISNVAAKALMATLTVGLSVAIGAAILLWDRYRSKQAAAKEEAGEFSKKVAESASKPISAIHALSAAWSRLGDDMEAKRKFVEDNKKRFDELGVSVNSVTDAESLLVANKSKFVEACLARAKALAVQELAVEKYKDVLSAQQALDATPKAYVTANGTYTDGYGTQRKGKVVRKSAEWQNAEDAVVEAQKSYDALIGQQVDFTAREREILASIGADADGVIEGSVAAIEKVIAAKRELLKGATNRDDYDRIAAEIKAEEKRLEVITGGKTGTSGGGNGATEQARRRTEELAKAERQLAADAADAYIDGMEDGYLKKRARAELDFEREKADIVRRGQELAALQGGLLTIEQSAQLEGLNRAAASRHAGEVRSIDKEYFSWAAEEQAWDEYLAEYGTYQQKRLAITEKYNKLIAAAATLGEAAGLEKERDRALAELVEYHKGAVNMESDLARKRIELSGRVYTFQSDREKELLELEKQRLETLRAMLENQIETAPTEELKNQLAAVNVELDGVNQRLGEMPTEKLLEVLGGFKRLAGELGKLGGVVGDIFSGIAGELDNVMVSFDKTSNTTDKVSAGVQGLVNIIGMISSASAKRKQAEKEFYQNQIALAHEYALALNEQLRLQSELSGSGFITDYAGQIDDAFASLTDATDNYNDAIAKLADGKAKVDLRNAVDWGNVGKGVASGAAVGAAIGSVIPVIGTAIGAVVGAVGGFFAGLFGGKKKKEVFGGLLEVFPELVDAAGNLNTELAQTLINTGQVDDATKQLLQNALDWEQQMAAASEQIKDIAVSLAGDLGNSLMRAIVDPWRAGKDGAEDMFAAASKSLEGFVEQLLYSKIFADAFKEFETGIVDALAGKTDILDVYDRLMEQVQENDDTFLAFLDAMRRRAGERGYEMWQPDDETADQTGGKTQSGRAGAFTTMSQDEGAELKGLFVANQMELREIRLGLEGLGPGLAEATGVLVEIREEVKTSNGWLKKIAEGVEKVIRDGLKMK